MNSLSQILNEEEYWLTQYHPKIQKLIKLSFTLQQPSKEVEQIILRDDNSWLAYMYLTYLKRANKHAYSQENIEEVIKSNPKLWNWYDKQEIDNDALKKVSRLTEILNEVLDRKTEKLLKLHVLTKQEVPEELLLKLIESIYKNYFQKTIHFGIDAKDFLNFLIKNFNFRVNDVADISYDKIISYEDASYQQFDEPQLLDFLLNKIKLNKKLIYKDSGNLKVYLYFYKIQNYKILIELSEELEHSNVFIWK